MSEPAASLDPGSARVVRELAPRVLSVLLARGADFSSAEDAVAEALLQAVTTWAQDPPRDPQGWLVTTAWRRWVDGVRSASARTAREEALALAPPPGDVPGTDDTLELYRLCAHPALSTASAAALVLRAVGGLTTRQVADAFAVPEATMAQRISRAKRTVREQGLPPSGSLTSVLRALYLVFNEGHDGDVDLCEEAIRLARELHRRTADEEAAGLLALLLLHHARRPARTDEAGQLVPLDRQDRTRWRTDLAAEGVAVLQAALARERRGEYQLQAAVAALHCDAATWEETDWPQVVAWYDDLVALTASPVHALGRVVALGEAQGSAAGLAALAAVPADVPRRVAVEARLREAAGERAVAANLYAEAARRATRVRERDHLVREAARLRQGR
ncbi:RNA polymerase sigma factor [Nocardioides bruguierae]|uniref:RNA polymerase sigma factor n=1 Tax=Nocardioides bruguierae TaxID=2945102 RepID=UPI0020214545|nr:DUF6596 domain-containing protein [Nocardioides bruguierae]MCL8025090.1 RNA polymerase subunit sigma-24 [Nocardioides bruguierae]